MERLPVGVGYSSECIWWGILSVRSGVVELAVVDESEVFRCQIRDCLESIKDSPYRVVTESTSAEEALELFKCHQPSLILLGINLGGIGTLKLARYILTNHPDVRFVFFCDEVMNLKLSHYLRLDCSMAFLLKTSSRRSIVCAIKKVLNGELCINAEIRDYHIPKYKRIPNCSLEVLRADDPAAAQPNCSRTHRLVCHETPEGLVWHLYRREQGRLRRLFVSDIPPLAQLLEEISEFPLNGAKKYKIIEAIRRFDRKFPFKSLSAEEMQTALALIRIRKGQEPGVESEVIERYRDAVFKKLCVRNEKAFIQKAIDDRLLDKEEVKEGKEQFHGYDDDYV